MKANTGSALLPILFDADLKPFSSILYEVQSRQEISSGCRQNLVRAGHRVRSMNNLSRIMAPYGREELDKNKGLVRCMDLKIFVKL